MPNQTCKLNNNFGYTQMLKLMNYLYVLKSPIRESELPKKNRLRFFPVSTAPKILLIQRASASVYILPEKSLQMKAVISSWLPVPEAALFSQSICR